MSTEGVALLVLVFFTLASCAIQASLPENYPRDPGVYAGSGPGNGVFPFQ